MPNETTEPPLPEMLGYAAWGCGALNPYPIDAKLALEHRADARSVGGKSDG